MAIYYDYRCTVVEVNCHMDDFFEEAYVEIYQSIIKHNPDAVIVFTREGKVKEVNLIVTNLLGYDAQEIQGLHYQQLIVSYEIEKVDRYFGEVLHGKSYSGELNAVHKSGKILPLQVKAIPLTVNKEIVSVFCVAKDFTLQKQLETSLKQYRLLAENSLDLIQFVNLDGIVTYASPSHKWLLGYGPEEYVGKWLFHRPEKEVDEKFKEMFFNMVLSQKPCTCEIVREHKEGGLVWIELIGTPMFDQEGKIEYMMLVGRNITERKKYERELEHLGLHDALTELPNRRLFNERMDHALKEAKRYGRKFAVMCLDMDNFKRINDTFGHATGDELLRQFSIRVKQCLRESDTIAQQGGDEFVILLPEIQNEEDALKIAGRILDSLQEPWHIGKNIFFRTTSSIGLAFYPMDGDTR